MPHKSGNDQKQGKNIRTACKQSKQNVFDEGANDADAGHKQTNGDKYGRHAKQKRHELR